jgi:hypothetical protein
MAKDPSARFPTAAAFGQQARRVAAGLAGTSTSIGPAGSPVSGPPVPSQTSPGPTGVGTPRPPAAGGTRVMPAAGFPTSAAARGGGPVPATGPAGGWRGAASVPPPPPPRPETGYLTGPPPPPRSSGRSTMVILGVLIGVLVLLGLGCVGLQVYRNVSNTSGNPTQNATTGHTGGPTRTGQPSTSPTGQLVSTFCDDAKGRSFPAVSNGLKRDGFKVDRQEVPGPRDIVRDITPCEAVRGTTVTVHVGNGQPTSDSGNTGGPGGDNNSSGPGGGLGCSLGIGGGVGGCSSGPRG